MVEAQSSPVSTAALCTATGLHENTVRGHLDRLRADGYVRREREATSGRGRPAWLWRAVRRAPESPYPGLATALAETLARSGRDAVLRAREAGRTWGREIAERRHDDGAPREAVVAAMRDQGFAPLDTGDAVLLQRCPLIEAATRHPEIVCAVHQGMIDGLLAARGVHSESRLLPFTAPGVCTLELRVAQ